MSYQLRRFDLLRSSHPGFIGLAVAGLAVALVGVKMKSLAVMGVGGFLYTIAVCALQKPVLTVMLGILGAGGGVITFFAMPGQEMQGATFSQRLIALVLFIVLYLDLMGTLLMLGAYLYNLLVQTVGLGGIKIEIAEEGAEAEA